MAVGVERDGTLRTDPTTRIDENDDVLVAGTDAMIQEFERGAGGS